jgi:hypothetical protein
MFSLYCCVTETILYVSNCYSNSYFLYSPKNNVIKTHTELKQLWRKKVSETEFSYHIYMVDTDYSRPDSHQDHPDSQDSHHTLFQVGGIVLMGTKVHCMLVLEQNPLHHLEQYSLNTKCCKNKWLRRLVKQTHSYIFLLEQEVLERAQNIFCSSHSSIIVTPARIN